ncbi:MAG: hypothetical protein ABR536_01635 [Solirubrobacterales bacterium]
MTEDPKEPNTEVPDPTAPDEGPETANRRSPTERAGVDETPESEEELKAKLEEEIKKVRVEDVILQSTVSILNLAARRIAKDDERDLAQGKIGIDASKALLDYLPEDASEQVREAVSELQLLYAKRVSDAP